MSKKLDKSLAFFEKVAAILAIVLPAVREVASIVDDGRVGKK